MNSPKYSLEALPTDSWEVRRTKQVARTILRVKTARSLTTDQLARQCSAFLGEEGSVKTATLNGLFAGKRKSISSAEVEMFAQVLGEPVLELLYPIGEQIEVKPGELKWSADAIVDAILITLYAKPSPFFLGSRVEAILRLTRSATAVTSETAKAIYHLQNFGDKTSRATVESLKWLVQDFTNAYSALEAVDKHLPDLPATATWSLGKERDSITPEFLLALDPLFDGYALGDFRLGTGEGSTDGEHSEEA